MPMRPLSWTDDGCRNIQPASTSSRTGRTNASRPMSPPTRVGADGRGDLGADEEPLDDRARDGEQDEQEREAVAALVLLERLGTERPEEPAGRVREAEPRSHDDGRPVGVADVALRRGGGLGRGLAGAREGDPFAGAPVLLVELAMSSTVRLRGDISAERRGPLSARAAQGLRRPA